MDLVRMQTRRIISLSPSSSETQLQINAANVLRYRYVSPYIRVVRDPANNLDASGITFSFQTAALLESPDDSPTWGERFVDLNYSINASGVAFSGATANGKTFTATAVSGKIPYIESPGGLLIWKGTNASGVNTNTAVFEIDLICHE